MDQCKVCKRSVGERYYRLNEVMVCESCGQQLAATEAKNKAQLHWRGLYYGIGVAVPGALLLWGVMILSGYGGGAILSPGAYARGIALVALASAIGAAVRAGSKRRSSTSLQVKAVLIYYLAYCVALTLTYLSALPAGRLSGGRVLFAILMSPFAPVIAIARSPLAISGLIVLMVGAGAIWRATENAVDLTGPYDTTQDISQAPTAEQPLFRTLGVK